MPDETGGGHLQCGGGQGRHRMARGADEYAGNFNMNERRMVTWVVDDMSSCGRCRVVVTTVNY